MCDLLEATAHQWHPRDAMLASLCRYRQVPWVKWVLHWVGNWGSTWAATWIQPHGQYSQFPNLLTVLIWKPLFFCICLCCTHCRLTLDLRHSFSNRAGLLSLFLVTCKTPAFYLDVMEILNCFVFLGQPSAIFFCPSYILVLCMGLDEMVLNLLSHKNNFL